MNILLSYEFVQNVPESYEIDHLSHQQEELKTKPKISLTRCFQSKVTKGAGSKEAPTSDDRGT